mgnify:FL=1
MIVTLWEKWHKGTRETPGYWEFNHIEFGGCHNKFPTVKDPSFKDQAREFMTGKWKRTIAVRSLDGVIIKDPIVVLQEVSATVYKAAETPIQQRVAAGISEMQRRWYAQSQGWSK